MNAITTATPDFVVAAALAAKVNALAGKTVAEVGSFVHVADEGDSALEAEFFVEHVKGHKLAFRNTVRAYSGVLNA